MVAPVTVHSRLPVVTFELQRWRVWYNAQRMSEPAKSSPMWRSPCVTVYWYVVDMVLRDDACAIRLALLLPIV